MNRTVLALACAAALAGCAGTPQRQALSGPRPIDGYAVARSFAAPAAAWPAQAWWKAYKDPQLDALVEEAVSGSPSLASAQARLKKAQAGIQVSASALSPQVSLNNSITAQKQSQNYLSPARSTPDGWNDYGRGTLDLSWEIDFWGKNKAALAAATSDAEAARAEEAQARLVLAAGVASAYAELARLHAALDTASAAAGVRAKTVELFRQRLVNGLETRGGVRSAESRLAAAQADVLSLGEQIDLQKNRIAALLGAGPDRGRRIQRPSIDLASAFALPERLPAELIGRRPDIVAARLRAEAAAKRIDQAAASFYPNVNLAGFIGRQSLGLDAFGNSGSGIGSIGPAISLPVFDGGRLRANLRGSEADYAAAVAEYDKAVVQALQEVADAATSQQALGAQLARANEAADAARDAWRIQSNRYEGGLATYLDVLSAEESLLSSLRSLTDLQSRSFTLDVALARALGGGYSTSIH